MVDESPLRKARLRAGLTQERLAGLLGASAGHISLVERGQRMPSMEMLDGIFGVLKLDCSERGRVVTWLATQRRRAGRLAAIDSAA